MDNIDLLSGDDLKKTVVSRDRIVKVLNGVRAGTLAVSLAFSSLTSVACGGKVLIEDENAVLSVGDGGTNVGNDGGSSLGLDAGNNDVVVVDGGSTVGNDSGSSIGVDAGSSIGVDAGSSIGVDAGASY